MGTILNGIAYDGGSIQVQIIPTAAPSALGGADNPLNKALTAGAKVLGALGLKDIKGIEAISYGITVDRVPVKGSGQYWNRGFTPGMIRYSNGSMTIWQSELNDWVDKSGGITAFCLNTEFDINIIYRSDYLPLTKIQLKGCRPVNVSAGHNFSSAENLTADIEFQVKEITFNDNDILSAITKGLKNSCF